MHYRIALDPQLNISAAELAAAWNAGATLPGTGQLLSDAGFESGTVASPWALEVHEAAGARDAEDLLILRDHAERQAVVEPEVDIRPRGEGDPLDRLRRAKCARERSGRGHRGTPGMEGVDRRGRAGRCGCREGARRTAVYVWGAPPCLPQRLPWGSQSSDLCSAGKSRDTMGGLYRLPRRHRPVRSRRGYKRARARGPRAPRCAGARKRTPGFLSGGRGVASIALMLRLRLTPSLSRVDSSAADQRAVCEAEGVPRHPNALAKRR